MIRLARCGDAPVLAALGVEFISAQHYGRFLTADAGAIQAHMHMVISGERSAIIVAEVSEQIVGMIGLQVVAHPLSGETTAAELFWFVRAGHRDGTGRALMKAAEVWARERSAVKFQMTAPDHRVAKLYERRGFEAVETTYQKELV